MSKKKEAQKQNGEPWSGIFARLDILIRLSALNIVKGIEKQKEQVAVLSDAGFKPKEIADVLRTTSNTVSVALTAIRKERASVKAEEEKHGKPEKTSVETPVRKITSEVGKNA